MHSPAGPPLSAPAPQHANVSAATTPAPSIAELFLAFAAISLSGFGGVLAWARRIMVERRRWFTAEEFNKAFALCDAVDVQHWLSDRQFADSSALAQLTPEPNLIIVTLIGYHVAGIAGAVVATLAMCGPISVLAFIVGRASERLTGAAWHGALTRGLVR
jgi:chromate transport protein ChrA